MADMGLYESQIETREYLDRKLTERAYEELADSVSPEGTARKAFLSDMEQADAAAKICLTCLGVVPGEVPESVSDASERIDWLCRPSGVMSRSVKLEGRWHHNTCGVMLGKLTSGEAVALLPGGLGGYCYVEPGAGRKIRITKANSGMIGKEALLFYKPLPAKPIGRRDLTRFVAGILNRLDYLLVFVSALVTTLIGLLPAVANHIIFDNVIPSGDISLVIPIGCFLLGAAISSVVLTACKNLIMSGISGKLDVMSQSAVFTRVLSLPVSFFKEYSPGDLANRISCVPKILQTAVSGLLGSGLSVVLSLILVIQIHFYAPMLTGAVLVVVIIQVILILAALNVSVRYRRASMRSSSTLSGTVASLLRGVPKLKLSGAEDRAFAKWAHQYAEYARYTYNIPLIMKALPAFVALTGMLGNIYFYYRAGAFGISVSNYMAFSAAYGQITAAVSMLATSFDQAASVIPMYSLIRPILEASPEMHAGKPGVTELTGSVEASGIFFRYNENDSYVIRDLSFKINPGEYVGIVGKSGCGKSTIMRLLLGMETPCRGSIFYGPHDLSTVDLKSVRRLIGTVMQGGKLFVGDIYSNIIISTPNATLDDAWEAAEIAGIAEDIRNMPMGMHTIITEGGGGISGGQRQRLLIARAVCCRRKILILDEATSALDNITQKHIADSLDKLSCTRIVIAHRLSTVKNCDRIFVVDDGHIAEEGTFDDLMDKKSLFYELVKRQQFDE